MRFCVSCRQNESILKEAQEIKVEYKDIAFIDNYLEREEKPHVIILHIPTLDEKINWDILKMYNEKLKYQFMLALDNMFDCIVAIKENIKCYWSFPINSYYELDTVLKLGVSQIILGVPLMFDKDYIQQKNIKIRLIPNYAFNEYMTDDGVCGGWIRPEDIYLWEDIAESCEFYTKNLQKEKAIFEIYKKKEWPDDLRFIINGLTEEFLSQYLKQDFGITRSKCRQICKKNSDICNYCEFIRKITINLNKKDELDKIIQKASNES